MNSIALHSIYLSTKHITEVPHCNQFMSHMLRIKILKNINNSYIMSDNSAKTNINSLDKLI